jgi:hypothetical protein
MLYAHANNVSAFVCAQATAPHATLEVSVSWVRQLASWHPCLPCWPALGHQPVSMISTADTLLLLNTTIECLGEADTLMLPLLLL